MSTAEVAGNIMRMETKFMRLRTPVEHGSRFGDWSVCWLGGWSKHRLYYLVMLVKLEPSSCLRQPALAQTLSRGNKPSKQKKRRRVR